jgi:hypothetical protein
MSKVLPTFCSRKDNGQSVQVARPPGMAMAKFGQTIRTPICQWKELGLTLMMAINAPDIFKPTQIFLQCFLLVSNIS